MNYSFKVTTEGRDLLATLLATGQVLELTRVAVGSGRVAEDVNLADMTDLIQYVAEGTLTQRRHEDNILYLTVQYASNSTPGLGAFYLSEFIVQAKHPDTGENVTFLYATLGDYIQHVNAYSEELPPDIRSYPMMIAISDEINVNITAPAGLVTYDELEQACAELKNTLISRTLLWENASPTSAFAAQSIELNLSDYDGIEIIGGDDSAFTTSTGYVPLKSTFTTFLTIAKTDAIYSRAADIAPFAETPRISFYVASSYKFADGVREESDALCIPQYIYGIKGVK